MGQRLRGALGRLLGLRLFGGGRVRWRSDDSGSRLMHRPLGRPVRPRNRVEAAWYLIEEGAFPVRPHDFAWPEVIALAGPSQTDPAVYLPGSAL